MNPHFSTKQRILSAAEQLFAKQGFAGASLRQVTTVANVNLAAVNYHFGSKENLINEIFRHRLDELSAKRLASLNKLQVASTVLMEDVLMAFVHPALEIAGDKTGGTSFVRILARTYAEHDQKLRQFLSDNYGHVLKIFADAISRQVPTINKETLYLRLDFISGALTYAMSDFGMVKRPSGRSAEQHLQKTAEQFVHFAAAGLRASE